jgi:Ca2+-binding RTX toxin-like protein
MIVRYAFALIGLLLVAPAGASGAATFGAAAGLTPMASDTPACCADAFLASPTAPADGVLVRWTLRRTGAAVSVAPAVRHSGTVTSDAATTATDVAVRLPIRTGDQIGFHQLGAMPDAFNGFALLVTGVLEADADHDDYGDETQDACPAEASLHVAPCTADIALTMSGPAFGVVDRDTPYDVTVANRGPSAAAGVALTDVVPAGARLVRTEGAGTCTPGATLRCTLPAIAAGASSTVTVVLEGTAEGARFRHTASVAASSTDPTPGDHSASVDTLVTGASVAPPALTLTGPPCVNPTFGGRDDDVLVGSTFGDRLFGRQGRDLLRGREGNDCLWGGEGADVLDGDGGDDSLWGGDGRDRLFGGTGNDRVLGGAKGDELHGATGNDQLFPGSGRDHVWGGPGNDTIAARDGSRDVIDCGAGLDRVMADRRDRLRGCEQVGRR